MPSYLTSTAGRETAATGADERLETAALEDVFAAEDTDDVVGDGDEDKDEDEEEDDEDTDEDEEDDEDVIVERAEEDCDDTDAADVVDVADERLRSDDVVIFADERDDDDADEEPSDGKSTPGVQAATRRTENARRARRMMTRG